MVSPRLTDHPGDESGVNRAVTPLVAVVLLVGLTVVLAASVTAASVGYAAELRERAPTVSQSAAEYERYAAGGGRYADHVIRLTHLAGDTLTVADLELVVDASDACGKVGRLVNVPIAGDDPVPTERYVRGDDVFDNSYNAVEGPIGTGDVDDDGEWSAGETAQFRLASGDCPLRDGDRLTVRVVHAPTNAVLVAETIRVRSGSR
ncbi:type IV pilin [Haloarcula marina]|uniref:type IV pilin n=1 Tax=Haloarcula marina TaxID=2961574 RepID=UPI0020B8F7B5|nr:type IV pilin [Halomicroarcula marina]